jgi:hypothetical protein
MADFLTLAPASHRKNLKRYPERRTNELKTACKHRNNTLVKAETGEQAR